jgi:hypothetical protein
MSAPEIKIFDTRDEMIKELLAPGSVIAEVGVFDGGFSERIFNINQPKELVLIDIWYSGHSPSGEAQATASTVHRRHSHPPRRARRVATA